MLRCKVKCQFVGDYIRAKSLNKHYIHWRSNARFSCVVSFFSHIFLYFFVLDFFYCIFKVILFLLLSFLYSFSFCPLHVFFPPLLSTIYKVPSFFHFSMPYFTRSFVMQQTMYVMQPRIHRKIVNPCLHKIAENVSLFLLYTAFSLLFSFNYFILTQNLFSNMYKILKTKKDYLLNYLHSKSTEPQSYSKLTFPMYSKPAEYEVLLSAFVPIRKSRSQSETQGIQEHEMKPLELGKIYIYI